MVMVVMSLPLRPKRSRLVLDAEGFVPLQDRKASIELQHRYTSEIQSFALTKSTLMDSSGTRYFFELTIISSYLTRTGTSGPEGMTSMFPLLRWDRPVTSTTCSPRLGIRTFF